MKPDPQGCEPSQQGSSRRPHAVHTFWAHTSGSTEAGSHAAPVAQQAWPDSPQLGPPSAASGAASIGVASGAASIGVASATGASAVASTPDSGVADAPLQTSAVWVRTSERKTWIAVPPAGHSGPGGKGVSCTYGCAAAA